MGPTTNLRNVGPDCPQPAGAGNASDPIMKSPNVTSRTPLPSIKLTVLGREGALQFQPQDSACIVRLIMVII
jgi:hypothetical protein